MYHYVVKRIARWSFDQLNQGNYEALLKLCTETVDHKFSGSHALGGQRRTVEGMRNWFIRLYKLFPGLQFEIKEMMVSGWPWNTRVVVEWIDRAKPYDGEEYVNEGVHILTIKWGKLAAIHAYLDTYEVHNVCDRLSSLGIKEAQEPPIVT